MKRILGFDGVRGLAAIAVVLTHLHVFEGIKNFGPIGQAIVPMISGAAGVQAFFVLSGFLITTLLTSELANSGTVSIQRFFIRRSLRIFPLYFGFMLVAAVLYQIDSKVTSPTSLAYGFAYVYNFIPRDSYTSFMGHTWSLAVEEHFYLIWPWVFLFFCKKRPRVLLLLLAAFIVTSLPLHAALALSDFGNTYFVERWTFTAGSSIAAGCLLALLLKNELYKEQAEAFLTSRTALFAACLIYALPALAYGRSWTFDAVASGYFRCAGITLAIGWLVFNQGSIVSKLLEQPVLRYLGAISYGIYMYQGLFLATGPHRTADVFWPLPQHYGFWLLLVAPPLSYHFFELPFLRLKDRAFARSLSHGEKLGPNSQEFPGKAT